MHHARGSGGGEFIEPVVGVDDHGSFGTEIGEGLGHRFDEGVVVDPDELTICAGGVGQWPEGIEDRWESERSAWAHRVFHRGVMMDRKAEAHAGILEASRLDRWRCIDFDPEGFENFGGATTCAGSVAVLGDDDAA